MWTESNATRTDPNDTTCRRRVASLASADERGAPPVRLCPEKHHPLRNADVSLRCSLPSQAAVVGATTVLMASPAFAATIKLGGDNGELGFYVSALSADRPAAARASVRGRSTGIAPIPGATLHTTHSGDSSRGSRSPVFFARRLFFFPVRRKRQTHLSRLLSSHDSPTRSPSPRVRPSSS